MTRTLTIVFGLLMVQIGAAPVFAANAGWLEPQLITLVTAIMLGTATRRPRGGCPA